jgi:2'-5' RNA ligase
MEVHEPEMTQLFTALDIPDSIKTELARLEPEGDFLKIQSHPHITLHFIGHVSDEIALDISSELNNIELAAYNQEIEGVGVFTKGRPPHILWAGVRKCAGLMNLHAAIGDCLTEVGLKLEDRDYTPHITIARLKHRSPGLVALYLSAHSSFKASFRVSSFAIFSSEFIDGELIYRKLQEYKLIPA